MRKSQTNIELLNRGKFSECGCSYHQMRGLAHEWDEFSCRFAWISMRNLLPYSGDWTLVLLLPVPFIAPNKLSDCFYIKLWVGEIRMELTIRWNQKFHKYDTNKGCYIRCKSSLCSQAKSVWEQNEHYLFISRRFQWPTSLPPRVHTCQLPLKHSKDLATKSKATFAKASST